MTVQTTHKNSYIRRKKKIIWVLGTLWLNQSKCFEESLQPVWGAGQSVSPLYDWKSDQPALKGVLSARSAHWSNLPQTVGDAFGDQSDLLHQMQLFSSDLSRPHAVKLMNQWLLRKKDADKRSKLLHLRKSYALKRWRDPVDAASLTSEQGNVNCAYPRWSLIGSDGRSSDNAVVVQVSYFECNSERFKKKKKKNRT